MKLLSDRVKVKLIPEEETINGIHIAPNPVTGLRNNYHKGKVVEIGKGKIVDGKLIPMTVKKGDIVIYPPAPIVKYKDEDGSYYSILFETDIWAVI